MKISRDAVCGIFSATLKEMRERRGLKAVELAAVAGISASLISQIEAGEALVALPTLVAVADALEVSTDYLLGRRRAAPVTGPVRDQVLESMRGMDARALTELVGIARSLERTCRQRRRPPEPSPPRKMEKVAPGR